MLSLQLKDGEYLTIGEDIVIQVSTTSAVRLSVKAPKDMTILRGEVLERTGEARPACLHETRPRRPQQTRAYRPVKKTVSNG